MLKMEKIGDNLDSPVASDSLLKETKEGSQDVIVETDKLIILRDKKGLYGDAAPSKAAPQYLQSLLSSPFLDKDNSSSSISETFDSSCSRTYEELVQWRKRVQEEERLSLMYKLNRTFSLRFDNRAWLHPHGTTNFDYKGIPQDKKEKVENFKNKVRKENYEYLGSHPEIQALISLAIKRLLNVLPHDPVKFIAEFFTTRMGNRDEFQRRVDEEVRKISHYHVNKMRAAGKITMKPGSSVKSEISGNTWRPEHDANYLKRLNIGALAQDFSFDPDSLKPPRKKSGKGDKLKKKKRSKKTCGPKHYCGCKDWKLKKNVEPNEDAEETEEQQTTTFSTLGNLNDNLLSSEGEGEEGEEGTTFGDGEFLGEMNERTNEHGNLTTADAEMIASLIVDEFLTGASPSSGQRNKGT